MISVQQREQLRMPLRWQLGEILTNAHLAHAIAAQTHATPKLWQEPNLYSQIGL